MFVKEMWHVVVTWSACLSHILLGRYVIKDDGGNYVTFHELNIRIKTKKKIINPRNESLDRLCSSVIGLSKFAYLVRPSF